MLTQLLQNAPAVRLGFFLSTFVAMALWEVAQERRALRTSKGARWVTNLSMIVVNSVTARLVVPMGAIGIASVAAENGWGLFNVVEVPLAVAVIASVVALDFAIWLQHMMFHAVPVLWRLHMMHHADLDLDVTSGIRFHPFEILLSLGIKALAIVLLGPPVVAVLVFEVILNAMALFNHSNVRIPLRVDRILRLFVVTPDMHRVHHSVEMVETNSNYGFNLPWWDRLFGTYRAQPALGHEAMEIGLSTLRDPKQTTFWRMLMLPFAAAPRDAEPTTAVEV